MKNNESKYKQVVNFVIDGIAEGTNSRKTSTTRSWSTSAKA